MYLLLFSEAASAEKHKPWSFMLSNAKYIVRYLRQLFQPF